MLNILSLKKKSVESTYTTVAEYYDELMYDVDYAGWVDYILRIFRRYNVRGRNILDIACGTGTVIGLFAKYGYNMIGVDHSKPMLDVARRKIQSSYPNTEFIQADMTKFHLYEKFDAVICLYDSLNYLLTEKALLKAYECAFAHLKAGGLYVFDMNTEFALTEIWGDGTTVRESDNLTSIWESEYDEKTRISLLQLTFFARKQDNLYMRGKEIHKETFYSYETIKRLLYKSGFAGVDLYQHLEFLPPAEKTYRIMAVAKKE